MEVSGEAVLPSVAMISTDFIPNTDPLVPNGCAWYRMSLPARELRNLGWDVHVGLPVTHPERGFGVAHKDGGLFGWNIAVCKLMMHESTGAMFRRMQDTGTKVVVDVDDFHFGLHEDNVAHRKTNPLLNPQHNRMFYEIGIRRADLVTVSTQFLGNFYSRRVRDVRIVRNALDVERFSMVQQPEKPVFGWVGATPWRSGDIEMLASWMPQFTKEHAISVHHAGHIPGDGRHFAARAGLKRVSVELMTTVVHYPKLLQKFHVGLVPLAPGDFNEAKSNLKGLEYAAAGIPFIATPTEEYRILHELGVGRLASSADEWRDHAVELLDPDIRVAEAQRNRALVMENFDISKKGEQWATALNG